MIRLLERIGRWFAAAVEYRSRNPLLSREAKDGIAALVLAALLLFMGFCIYMALATVVA